MRMRREFPEMAFQRDPMEIGRSTFFAVDWPFEDGISLFQVAGNIARRNGRQRCKQARHSAIEAMNISSIKPTGPVQARGFAIQPIISLHEYRERYPGTASIPTLTQLGLIWPLLERRLKRSARREKRRAIRQKVIQVFIQHFAELWRTPGRSNPA